MDVYVSRGLRRLDAVVITHEHADAMGGLDCLRDFTNNFVGNAKPLPVYCTERCFAVIKASFPYLTAGSPPVMVHAEVAADTRSSESTVVPVETAVKNGGVAAIEFRIFDECKPFSVCELPFTGFPVEHGGCLCTAFRIGELAYVSDVKSMSEESRGYLRDAGIVVFDALTTTSDDKKHPSHLNLLEAIEEARSGFDSMCTPRNVFLVGMSHRMSHQALLDRLDAEGLPHVRPAFDKQAFKFSTDSHGHVAVPETTTPAVSRPLPSKIGEPVESTLPPFPARLPDVELEGKVVRLQPINLHADLEELYAASNGAPLLSAGPYDSNDSIWRYMPIGPFSSLEAFSTTLTALVGTPDLTCYTLVHVASGTKIGSLSFMTHVPEMRRLEIGMIWITPAMQGTVAVKEAVFLMLQHAFETLRYRRVEWKCNAHNVRSRRLAARLGFSFEGVFRNHMIVKGANRDTAYFSITDADWRQKGGSKDTLQALLEAIERK